MRAAMIAGVVVLCGALVFAVEEAKPDRKLINDFELDTDKEMFADSRAQIELSTEHATSGEHSLKVVWTKDSALSAIGTLPEDWSGWKWLKFDLFIDGADANFTLRLKDKARKGYDVWQYPVTGGTNTVTVNLETAAATIDLKQVFHFFVYLVDAEQTVTGYVDNMRLEK